ncbi:Uncharacterised protein [Vibrio cholerae]|nr:Uncharacterised protein [Vibrio cholerae]
MALLSHLFFKFLSMLIGPDKADTGCLWTEKSNKDYSG